MHPRPFRVAVERRAEKRDFPRSNCELAAAISPLIDQGRGVTGSRSRRGWLRRTLCLCIRREANAGVSEILGMSVGFPTEFRGKGNEERVLHRHILVPRTRDFLSHQKRNAHAHVLISQLLEIKKRGLQNYIQLAS